MSNQTHSKARGCARLLARALAVGLLVLGLLAIASAVWFQREVLDGLPDVQGIVDYKPPQACRVLDAEGNEIDVFYVERRFWVPLGVLPRHLLDAFVAAEDQRFWEHRGVDPQGILRAARANWEADAVVQGGSTITQQLVKNLLVGDAKSLARKAREATLALRLEQRLTKEEILELYLNYVFLGSGNHGIEAAARDYFGVSARDVTVGQAALLAGLVPAPSATSPRLHPRAARAARTRVIEQMAALQMIERPTAEAARLGALLAPSPEPVASGGLSYVTAARRVLRERFGDDVAEAGLTVHTAMDPAIQRLAEDGVRVAVRGLVERQGGGGVRGAATAEDWAARAPDGPDASGDCFTVRLPARGALDRLEGPGVERTPEEPGPTWSLDPSERRAVLRHEGARARVDRLPAGTLLGVCALKDRAVTLDPTPWAEGAAVVLENATGRVLAVVGGRDVALEDFDRATQALRQPGSAFKPFVYAAALSAGWSSGDLVDTAPLTLRMHGRTWSPRDGVSAGPIPLRTALALSSNTASVRLLRDVGAEEVAETAARMGISSPLVPVSALALGASEVTPLDMAVAYSTLTRLGAATHPVFLDRVTWPDGAQDPLERPTLPRALDPGVAYELLDMLRGVVERGTGKGARRDGLDRAGKTGTTNDAVDTWFVGSTPAHTVAVWVGSDEPEGLGRGEAGGRTALPGWTHIVDALPTDPDARFERPAEVLLAPDAQGVVRVFRRGTTPGSVLPLHSLRGQEPLPPFPGR